MALPIDELKTALATVAIDAANNAQAAAQLALNASQQATDDPTAMGGQFATADAAGQTALRAAQVAQALSQALVAVEERFPTTPA